MPPHGGMEIKMDKKDFISGLIEKMTLDEKIGQLNQEWTTNDRMEELESLAAKGMLGSCILTDTPWAGNSAQEDLYIDRLNKIQKAAVEKSRMGIPVINGRDVIHGSKTIFPIPLAQAASWDYDLIKDSARIMSEEASYDGVHWTFAPMLDICTDPRWGRIIESPGEDPYLGRMFARASVEGIQGKDMKKPTSLAACAKHYIGYGASCGGRDKDPCEWSEYSLKNRALPAFKEAVENNVATVMSSFNEISGQPVTSSEYHIKKLLKEELGFNGFVVSDWAAIERLKCQGVSDNDKLSAVLSLKAGVDMDMVDNIYINNLKEAVKDGDVSEALIDEAVERILSVKYDLGLFENPYFSEDDNSDKFMKKEYLDKAKEICLNSMVLLKNNGVLPLKKGSHVSVSGPMAEEKESLLGSWHAGGRAEDVISLADGIRSVNGANNVYVKQSSTFDCLYRFMDYTDTMILGLGESSFVTGEGNSLADISLSQEQIECARFAKEKGKNVIAVVFAGRPLAITALMHYCDAVLWAWHGGTECGTAAAEILFGDFNPCGRLPVTIPRSTGQIPIFYNHNRNECDLNGYYENKMNYRDCVSTPLFEFGYGLSYSDFSYGEFKTQLGERGIEVTMRIKNVGGYDGSDVVQCYVSDVVASASRPIKELKAYKKLFLKKGEERSITLCIPFKELEFYNIQGERVFENGEFEIQVGKSCKNILFSERITVNKN